MAGSILLSIGADYGDTQHDGFVVGHGLLRQINEAVVTLDNFVGASAEQTLEGVMKKNLLALAIVVVLASIPALALVGSNECDGIVQVGEEWTTVAGEMGDYAPNGCQFRTASKLGRRILAVCPDGSECQIDLPLQSWPATAGSADVPVKPVQTITTIASVRRLR